MSPSHSQVIAALGLQPLPGEGGFYKETYRSPQTVSIILPGHTETVTRATSTQIFYLVNNESFSVLHRLKQDEVYHFYGGSPAELLLIYPDGRFVVERLGSDFLNGEKVQVTIPAGVWQGVRLSHGNFDWSLMGTTVAPGFEFADFELGIRDDLLKNTTSEKLKQLIIKYTRE